MLNHQPFKNPSPSMLFSVGKEVTIKDIDTSAETMEYLCSDIGFPKSNNGMVSHMLVSLGISFEIVGINIYFPWL
jgi:hypothetical protein